MLILRTIILKNPALKVGLNIAGLTGNLLNSLFALESAGAKFKEPALRQQALSLLEGVSEGHLEESDTVRKCLDGMHSGTERRTNRKEDWMVASGTCGRNGFVGLRNLGATCYVNSLLQQLFMIPLFRKEIIEAQHDKVGKEESILFQLQLVFTSLMASQRTVYNPWDFTRTIRMDNQPFSPYEQKDVDEFLIHLLDRIDQELKGAAQEKLVGDTFKLTFANEVICKDCPHRSETLEESLSVILNVKNKRTVYESLNAYVQSDVLEGDNAYYCERCDRKVTAHKRQTIKTLPNTLLIVLKRFEFNYETMMKAKVNDYCEFPQELNLEEFTQEGQTAKELNAGLESGQLLHEDLSDDQKKMLKRQVPQYYYKYKLKGIIVHSGYADAGHYYSYILDRNTQGQSEDRWFEFNDSIVRPFDPKDIPEEAFGGEEEVDSDVDEGKEVRREKVRNAYVLLYEREVKLDPAALEKYKQEEKEVEAEDISKIFNRMVQEERKVEIKIPEALDSVVSKDNKNFWIAQYTFNKDYLEFIADLLAKTKIPSNTSYEKARKELEAHNTSGIETVRFAIKFLLTTALRVEYKDELPKVMGFIDRACKSNVKACIWICKLFCYPSVLREFLVECPYTQPMVWFIQLLHSVIPNLYAKEKAKLNIIVQNPSNLMSAKEMCKVIDLPETAIVGNRIHLSQEPNTAPYLLLAMDALVQLATEQSANAPAFKALCYFAGAESEVRKYLNACSVVGVAFEAASRSKGKCWQLADKFVVHVEVKEAAPIDPAIASALKKQTPEKLHHSRYLLELICQLIRPKSDKEVVRLNAIEEQYMKSLGQEERIEYFLSQCTGSKVAVNFYVRIMVHLCETGRLDKEGVCKLIVQKLPKVDARFLDPLLKLYLRLNKGGLEQLSEVLKRTQGNPRLSEAVVNCSVKSNRKGKITQNKIQSNEKYVDDMLYKKFPTAKYFLRVTCALP